jgi:hypothetical protein
VPVTFSLPSDLTNSGGAAISVDANGAPFSNGGLS